MRMRSASDAAGSPCVTKVQRGGFSKFLSQSTTPGVFANEAIPGGAPASDALLGITLRFTLSAGDTVSVASTFTVTNVPAPGALALLAVSGATGVGRRRRR